MVWWIGGRRWHRFSSLLKDIEDRLVSELEEKKHR
ncbi:unnamed protein product [Brassica rapa subsp. trilocularis]